MEEYINFLQVGAGDSIHIRFKDKNVFKNIIIDSGELQHYNRVFKKKLDEISEANESVDLLIITHTDNDHIKGALTYLNQVKSEENIIKKCWFNFKENIKNTTGLGLSIQDGPTIEKKLEELGIEYNKEAIHASTNKVDFWGARITILSPNTDGLKSFHEKIITTGLSNCISDYNLLLEDLAKKEECFISNEINTCSIGFLFECKTTKILFLADSSPIVVAESLINLGYSKEKKLELTYMQIAHHGSKYNTSYELLELIECSQFVISTNGSNCCPTKQTISKIVVPSVNRSRNVEEEIMIHLNHDLLSKDSKVITKEEEQEYNFAVNFNNLNGCTLPIV